MFLPLSPLPKAVAAAGQFLRPPDTGFSSVFESPIEDSAGSAETWLQRRQSHSRLPYQGVLNRIPTPPRQPVRLCPSLAFLAPQPLKRRRRADEQPQQPVTHNLL